MKEKENHQLKEHNIWAEWDSRLSHLSWDYDSLVPLLFISSSFAITSGVSFILTAFVLGFFLFFCCFSEVLSFLSLCYFERFERHAPVFFFFFCSACPCRDNIWRNAVCRSNQFRALHWTHFFYFNWWIAVNIEPLLTRCRTWSFCCLVDKGCDYQLFSLFDLSIVGMSEYAVMCLFKPNHLIISGLSTGGAQTESRLCSIWKLEKITPEISEGSSEVAVFIIYWKTVYRTASNWASDQCCSFIRGAVFIILNA